MPAYKEFQECVEILRRLRKIFPSLGYNVKLDEVGKIIIDVHVKNMHGELYHAKLNVSTKDDLKGLSDTLEKVLYVNLDGGRNISKPEEKPPSGENYKKLTGLIQKLLLGEREEGEKPCKCL
jgi:hypothetical protein